MNKTPNKVPVGSPAVNKFMHTASRFTDKELDAMIAVADILLENNRALPVKVVEGVDPALGLSFVEDGILYISVEAIAQRAAG